MIKNDVTLIKKLNKKNFFFLIKKLNQLLDAEYTNRSHLNITFISFLHSNMLPMFLTYDSH